VNGKTPSNEEQKVSLVGLPYYEFFSFGTLHQNRKDNCLQRHIVSRRPEWEQLRKCIYWV